MVGIRKKILFLRQIIKSVNLKMYALRNALPRARSLAPWFIPKFRNTVSSQTENEHKLVLEPLLQRKLVRVSGKDVVPFLQGLTTNDMRLLESPSVHSIFTMFLNKAGRVMFDAIVYKTPDPETVVMECDKEVWEELKKHLKMYIVRRKINIDDISDEAKVWVLFDKDKPVVKSSDLVENDKLQVVVDPRIQELGVRLLTQPDLTHNDIAEMCKSMGDVQPQNNMEYNYKTHRYSLGVAEGIEDIQPSKLFPLEANCDLLNGVSFNKGCYIGQELTARVHHTGVIRKRHMPVQLEDSLPTDSERIIRKEDGTKVGTVLGNIGHHAIGLVRIEQALKNKNLYVDKIKCNAEVPQWWPSDVLNNVSRRDAI